jgi:hypothetical protein
VIAKKNELDKAVAYAADAIVEKNRAGHQKLTWIIHPFGLDIYTLATIIRLLPN